MARVLTRGRVLLASGSLAGAAAWWYHSHREFPVHVARAPEAAVAGSGEGGGRPAGFGELFGPLAELNDKIYVSDLIVRIQVRALKKGTQPFTLHFLFPVEFPTPGACLGLPAAAAHPGTSDPFVGLSIPAHPSPPLTPPPPFLRLEGVAGPDSPRGKNSCSASGPPPPKGRSTTSSSSAAAPPVRILPLRSHPSVRPYRSMTPSPKTNEVPSPCSIPNGLLFFDFKRLQMGWFHIQRRVLSAWVHRTPSSVRGSTPQAGLR